MSPPQSSADLTPTRWVNRYTAVAEIPEDEAVEVGDEYVIPTREIQIDSWWQRLEIWANKQTTPPGEYHNIHLEKDTVRTKVVSVADTQCALEIIVTHKFHGTRSLASMLRDP